MGQQKRHSASKLIELALAGILAGLLLAMIHAKLHAPFIGASIFWSLAVWLPSVAVVFGCLRQKPIAQLLGWTILLVEIALIAHG